MILNQLCELRPLVAALIPSGNVATASTLHGVECHRGNTFDKHARIWLLPVPFRPRFSDVKRKVMVIRCLVFLIAALTLVVSSDARSDQLAINYQGQLLSSGMPFTGNATLEFVLFNQPSGGEPISDIVKKGDLPVKDGLFQVELDFGPNQFSNETVYLQIFVEGVALSPRKKIHVSPVALVALDGNKGPPGRKGETGPQGLAGPQGAPGPAGLRGPIAPHTQTIELCMSGEAARAHCRQHCTGSVVFQERFSDGGACRATSDLGSCGLSAFGGGRGQCCVCRQVPHQ